MDFKDLLENLNCKDIELTLKRFVGDYDFYIESVKEFINDVRWMSLDKSIKAKLVKETFDAAHLLKGVAGNCGLTTIYNLLIQIVEPLRDEAESENDKVIKNSVDFEKLFLVYEKVLEERIRINDIIGGIEI